MERNEIPMDMNPQVPLPGERLTHSSDWGTVKTRKVPLAALGCGRRQETCHAEKAPGSSGVRKAGARQVRMQMSRECERFPTPHMPGRDGWLH